MTVHVQSVANDNDPNVLSRDERYSFLENLSTLNGRFQLTCKLTEISLDNLEDLETYRINRNVSLKDLDQS